jgi:hypothetical protein
MNRYNSINNRLNEFDFCLDWKLLPINIWQVDSFLNVEVRRYRTNTHVIYLPFFIYFQNNIKKIILTCN